MTDTRTRSSDPECPTVGVVARYVLSHPWRVFVLEWNWKTALLSAVFRIALWPAMARRGELLSVGSLRGASIEFVFRLLIGGFWGSLLQAFSIARPAWQVGLIVVGILPGCAHSLEFLALRAGGTPHSATATVVSIAFSMLSLLVNWSLMRKGILVTDRNAASLKTDLQRTVSELASLGRSEKGAGKNSERTVP